MASFISLTLLFTTEPHVLWVVVVVLLTVYGCFLIILIPDETSDYIDSMYWAASSKEITFTTKHENKDDHLIKRMPNGYQCPILYFANMLVGKSSKSVLHSGAR